MSVVSSLIAPQVMWTAQKLGQAFDTIAVAAASIRFGHRSCPRGSGRSPTGVPAACRKRWMARPWKVSS